MAEPVPFGARVAQLARDHPQRAAITFVPVEGPEQTLSWAELDGRSNAVALLLAERGVGEGGRVVIALPNGPEHYAAAIAAWKLGALAIPLKATMPERERGELLEVAAADVVLADGWAGATLGAAQLRAAGTAPAVPWPDRVARPGKAIPSGGSTGRPKIIVDPHPWAFVPGGSAARGLGVRMHPGRTQLVAGAVFHNSPFTWSHLGLFEGQHLVVMERFDAARAVELVERFRVSFMFLAPVMMQRIARLPGIEQRDLTSIDTLFHTAAPCPRWLKRRWLGLLPPERVVEGFGSTEAVGATRIDGVEWLAHPGSVGRAHNCEIRILDEQGRPVPPGIVGEIHMRPLWTEEPTYEYLGAPRLPAVDGFTSVGDMGRLDADGYLYLADRRRDMINNGGANVYPAEVEGVLTAHPAVRDAAVVGLPDGEMGQRVHAVVECGAPVTAEELIRYCREQLSSEKVPRSIALVDRLPRDEAGKLRRSTLVATDGKAT